LINPLQATGGWRGVSFLLCGENGFEVTKGIAGLPMAFKAVLKGKTETPRVGILAEYDALAGLGHACGHNIIAASAVDAGISLAKLIPEINGTLIIFGTPAEEGIVQKAGGKVVMLEEFKGLDAAMMIHGLDMTTVICESFNREALEIEFIGKAANAGNTEDASKEPRASAWGIHGWLFMNKA
jgi:metal-dependent amidase/aminoacylase/carboxypeptidase family protein